MKQDVRVGVVGLGGRGRGIVRDVLLELGAKVTAVCDLYEDRRDQTADIVEAAGQPRPFITADYREVLASRSLTPLQSELGLQQEWWGASKHR